MNRGRRRLLATGVAVAAVPVAVPAQATPDGFMQRALAMREQAVASGDQAYGAVVVLDGRIVGEAPSAVVTRDDPTAHAEMEAIRDAARRLGRRDLGGAVLYSTSRPCPMCEAAAYWAGIAGMIHGSALTDAGAPGLGRC
ncbi:MAG: nucleoside deaminase [Geminicoccaceae bacterium]